MSGPRDLVRWARLLGSLPADERRARTARVTDRLLRRSKVVRALGLKASTPSWRSFEAALDVPLDELTTRLARLAADRVPLWLEAPALAAPDPAVPEAIDWHTDPVSGVRWDPTIYFTDVETVRLDGSDVKVPWEWSRLQHLLLMGRARSREAAAQVLSWIADNPPGLGVNWASPMEAALRAVSLAAALGYFQGLPGWEPPVVREIARSLWIHGRHVRSNLEIPEDAPATNHYLANLLGLLAIARLLPELAEAHSWGTLARSGLIEQIERQVGLDGVSFERSLPYHRFVAEIFSHAARLERAAGSSMPPAYLDRLAAMHEALGWSTRPDGTIPAWGDGDDGRVVARGPSIEARHAGAFAACGRRFEASGWHVMRGPGVHVGVAAGPVGTRGLGNHTHNDLFAPSYWAGGREWIVDPGTGSYARDIARRNRLRGVAAHAALQLGTREPNELPPGRDGLFRVVEKAHPEVVSWESTRERAVLVARHGGYAGPEGAWTWQRRLSLDAASGKLLGKDRLEAGSSTDIAAAPQDAWLRFPLAPGLTARIEVSSAPPRIHVVVSDEAGGGIRIDLAAPAGSEARVEPCEVSPRYGVVVAATAIVVRIPVSGRVEASWTVAPAAPPGLC